MTDSSVDLIIRLPSVLSCEILSAWLHAPDLVRTDSAYCNHENRPQLHALYKQPGLICSNRSSSEYIDWFIERKIRLRDFNAYKELKTGVAVGYLQEFGRTIESISLSAVTNLHLIEAVRANCANVCNLKMDHKAGEPLTLLNTFKSLHSLNIYFAWNCGGTELSTDDLDEVQHLQKLRFTWEWAEREMQLVLSKSVHV